MSSTCVKKDRDLILLIYFIFKLSICSVESSPLLNLYKTDSDVNHLSYDCFYYKITDDGLKWRETDRIEMYQIVEYCRRPFPTKDRNNESIEQGTNVTFDYLKKEGVSAQQLFSWSAPIDIIERYQYYLMDQSNYSTFLFYNCSTNKVSSKWFGEFCQYTFESSISFSQHVKNIFHAKIDVDASQKDSLTCYIHHSCNRGPGKSCLDWREICDRTLDCLNGDIDEKQCWQLEINECQADEYRCYNGQCIPGEFFQDDYDTPDCLDGSDELNFYEKVNCYKDPSFRCEERSITQTNGRFVCGDGAHSLIALETSYMCPNGRTSAFIRDWFAFEEHSYYLFYDCWAAMICVLKVTNNDTFCSMVCKKLNQCITIIRDSCPMEFFFSFHPVMFTHVRFIYQKNQTKSPQPTFICYDKQLCDFLNATYTFNNSACRRPKDFLPDYEIWHDFGWVQFLMTVRLFFESCLVSHEPCHNKDNMYQCQRSSKCISKYRLLDGITDCNGGDDEESNDTCLFNDRFRFRCITPVNKCISPMFLHHNLRHCSTFHEEEKIQGVKKNRLLMAFSMFCDMYQDIEQHRIDGVIRTDEDECDMEWWSCDNHYTRCNKNWNCPNGLDEANCPNATCPPNSHSCLSPDKNELFCLPLAKANDGKIDCRGAADERQLCRKEDPYKPRKRYRCLGERKCVDPNGLCNEGIYDSEMHLEIDGCKYGDDFKFCSAYQPVDFANDGRGICHSSWDKDRTKDEVHLCNLAENLEYGTYTGRKPIPLSLKGSGNYPSSVAQTVSFQFENSSSIIKEMLEESETNIIHSFDPWLCNRGIPVLFGASKVKKCFCPPSYYGDLCEYQNKRVSLTIQFRTENPLEWRTAFHFVITLIDTNSLSAHSSDQIVYLSMRDCNLKFNIYLLYAEWPQDSSKNYSIRIDGWQKADYNYRASWIVPIQFHFLPVNRVAKRIIIPTLVSLHIEHCTLICGQHGQCLYYLNSNEMFCRCDPGWLGRLCSDEYKCECALGSICLGLTIHGESICLCQPGQFGQRCYLNQSSCNLNPCQNGGLCISGDERISTTHFTCICSNSFFGPTCSSAVTKIIFQFSKKVLIPSSVIVHFITAFGNAEHVQTTTLKKIAFDQDTFTIYQSKEFHIIFVEMQNNYYLTFLRENYVPTISMTIQIVSDRRCAPIKELFNETWTAWHILRRMKRYHLPCREHAKLTCFYDESLMCLCNPERHANCFKFNHNMTYDCQENSYCENRGHCLQDNNKCPSYLICVCAECFFGTKCQFSTHGYGLSLDAIIGYQIRPGISLFRQTMVFKTSAILVTIMFLLGLINGFVSILTFKGIEARAVGCGIYLFVSSMTSLFTATILAFKFWFLIITQLNHVTVHSILFAGCVSIDALMRFSVTTGDWLNACVAIERLATVGKGIHFDKEKSKHVAKWIICAVIFLTFATAIQDTFHRQLIEDVEEKRIWCVVKYPPSFVVWNSIINIIHFLVPFSINLISVLVIIIMRVARSSIMGSHIQRRQYLMKQLSKHRHLLVSQCVIIVLATPRLIISFVSGCMTSARDPWLFLISFFVAFVPSTLLFVVFVVPSKIYRTEFKRSFERLRTRMYLGSKGGFKNTNYRN